MASYRVFICAAALAGSALLGCSAKRAPAPRAPEEPCSAAKLELVVQGVSPLNPAHTGESRPLQVRVYILKGSTRLSRAAFEEIWQSDAETLGNELIKVEEHVIFPDKVHSFPLALPREARAIGLVGLFREPQGRSWLWLHELEPPPKGTPCGRARRRVELQASGMQLVPGGVSDHAVQSLLPVPPARTASPTDMRASHVNDAGARLSLAAGLVFGSPARDSRALRFSPAPAARGPARGARLGAH